ncbi:MAG: hypothetical protein HYR56_25705 [Acidobacteria bacterium]|nr:hypothetical protein [Acidobacteriota bacterium]MBI3424761.1 hypothetical protein [Acidobacteriota bacterium]
MKTKLLFLVTSLALLLGLVSPLTATTVKRKNFNELVQEAELVAIGRIINVQAFPTADKQYVYTYVTVNELDILKGSFEESQLTLRMDGGDTGDGRRLVIPGVPKFQFGEQVVIFLKGNGQAICPFVGWEQGLLRIEKDQKSGESLVKSSRGQRIHGIKSGAFLLDAGEQKGQQQDGVYLVDAPGGNSAGQADNGGTQPLQALTAAEQQDDLSLTELRQQVHAVLLKGGNQRSVAAKVKSAEITFETPAQRSARRKN